MGKISLEGLTFYAYHGFYERERELGNTFEVNITVEADFEKAAIDDELAETVDYEKLYAIASEVMEVPSKLLEQVVYKMASRILKELPVNSVEVSLSKFNPPISGECKKATVSLCLRR
ncbi:dihydroneopterin aldolase [Fulvivirga sp.]|uniref:dihydroneopterin aldolase n=1 Tax=Fulvivirga sp. TaxID=1931237 RepID=UPI0032EB6260